MEDLRTKQQNDLLIEIHQLKQSFLEKTKDWNADERETMLNVVKVWLDRATIEFEIKKRKEGK